MEDQGNYLQEQARKAQENRMKMEASARDKLAERMRENIAKQTDARARQAQEADRKRAEEARAKDRQQQELRARAREHAKEKAKELVRKEQQKEKEQQPKQMAGSSRGPTMRPSSGNKDRDALEMAAGMDHPGLTDGMKAELHRQGVAVGEGWHNREEQRKKEAEARESRKTPQGS